MKKILAFCLISAICLVPLFSCTSGGNIDTTDDGIIGDNDGVAGGTAGGYNSPGDVVDGANDSFNTNE